MLLACIIAASASALPSFDELWSKSDEDVLGSFAGAQSIDGNLIAYDFSIDGVQVRETFQVEDGRIASIAAVADVDDPALAARVCRSFASLVTADAGQGTEHRGWVPHVGSHVTSCETWIYKWKTPQSEIEMTCGAYEDEKGHEVSRRLGLFERFEHPYGRLFHFKFRIEIRAKPIGHEPSQKIIDL